MLSEISSQNRQVVRQVDRQNEIGRQIDRIRQIVRQIGRNRSSDRQNEIAVRQVGRGSYQIDRRIIFETSSQVSRQDSDVFRDVSVKQIGRQVDRQARRQIDRRIIVETSLQIRQISDIVRDFFVKQIGRQIDNRQDGIDRQIDRQIERDRSLDRQARRQIDRRIIVETSLQISRQIGGVVRDLFAKIDRQAHRLIEVVVNNSVLRLELNTRYYIRIQT